MCECSDSVKEAPDVGEPLVLMGVEIPWSETCSKRGWFVNGGVATLGIELLNFEGVFYYRYLRMTRGPWGTSEDFSYSVKAMCKDLRQFTRPKVDAAFLALLEAVGNG